MLKKLTNVLSASTTTSSSSAAASSTTSIVASMNSMMMKNNLLLTKNNLIHHHHQSKASFSSLLNVSHYESSSPSDNISSNIQTTTTTQKAPSKNCTTKKYIEDTKPSKASSTNINGHSSTSSSTSSSSQKIVINTKLNTSVKNFIRNSSSSSSASASSSLIQSENDKKIKKQKSTDLKSLSLKLHEPLFGSESVENISKLTEYSNQVKERILKLYQNYEPYQYVELTRYLLYLNQVQYIPDVITMANKNRNVISHYSFAKELAYQLERKGKHIHSHLNEYEGIDTKLILNQCSKCLDLMISSGYKAVKTTNTDIFIDMLCYRIKMFHHSNDFKGNF
ncbi:predicted protein [Naegleria gruberi]|uniref:Predicted protein n=1 Tax=Naegleria gruberi TaxID=5762 RepID=D2VXP0_NAEGR|nr:uncharacterized protein NAEGRDRAFT_73817 [Naegleria gruberi]EFC38325.1 predicted protein [Naegleria gruberi]|eukprot:XP_002671069.1 predicted protein [Naegleria gruberi strain NEG-M]